jgi:hypothetical protein
VPVYDARKRQIQVPQQLSKIPDMFPRYEGDIPDYSLALVAYTVNAYTPVNGVRKNLFTVTFNIQFCAVLHEPNEGSDAGDE